MEMEKRGNALPHLRAREYASMYPHGCKENIISFKSFLEGFKQAVESLTPSGKVEATTGESEYHFKRRVSLEWWNTQKDDSKKNYAEGYLGRLAWEFVTGREIQRIFEMSGNTYPKSVSRVEEAKGKDLMKVALTKYSTPHGDPNPSTYAFIEGAKYIQSLEQVDKEGEKKWTDAEYIVMELAEWSEKYPKNRVYSTNHRQMEEEFEAIEEEAKEYLKSLNPDK